MILRNEFAAVKIELDETGNGPRLMIQDVRTDQAIYLDPLELESLAWRQHKDLSPFLDPSQRLREDGSNGDLPRMLKGVNVDL